MALPIKTVELPFESGLDQKADTLWLDAGASNQATNLVKRKRRSLQKRQGLQALTKNWNTSSTGTLNVSGTVSSGRRLGSFRGEPILFGQGSGLLAQQQAVFNFQDSVGLGEWVATDLAPSMYALPYEIVGPQAPFLGECDLALANGLELYAYNAQSTINVFGRSAIDGSIWLKPTALDTLGIGLSQPKVIVCSGRYFVVAWVNRGGPNINAIVIDSLTPAAPVIVTKTRINVTNGDNGNNININNSSPFDIATSLLDTNNFTLLYQSTIGGATHITARVLVGSTLVGVRNANVDAADAQWTTDVGVSQANAQLTGLALRADNGLNELAFSYAWKTGSTVRVSAGLFVYTTLLVKRSTINLLAGGSVGPISVTADNAPVVVTLELVKNVASKSTLQTRWSPASGAFNQGTTQMPYIASWQWSDTGAALAAATTQFPSITVGVTLFSRDLLLNGIAYCVGYCPSSTQGTFFLFADDAWTNTAEAVGGQPIDWYPLRLEAILAPRLSSGLSPTGAVFQPSSQCHFVANPNAGANVYETLFPIATGPNSMAIALAKFDAASPLDKSSGELGANLLVAGGTSSIYDGQHIAELAFPYYPVITAVAMAGAAGALSAGVYQYIAVYRWQDTRGQTHLSARSAPFVVTAGATNTATITIGVMGISGKTKALCVTGAGSTAQSVWSRDGVDARTVQILVYRTQVGGSVFNNLQANGLNSLINLQAQTVQSVVDGASDASILSHDLLYGDGSDGTTPGNILDEECAPASQFLVIHQQRAFFLDGPRVWPTKQFTTFAGLGVNEATAFAMPANVTGAASMDDKLILFTMDAPYWMSGLGPDNSGQNNDWNQPQRIPADAGCTDWRSVVVTPEGCYYQSPAGRRLLTRDLHVQPVTVVEDQDTSFPVVTSALIHPNAGRTVWTQNTDDTTAPRVGTLTLNDYMLGSWSTAQLNDSGGHLQHGFVSSMIANAATSLGPPTVTARTLHLLRADGTVMRESPSSSFDVVVAGAGNLFVPLTWQSPWIKADGLQGWSMWSEVRIAFQMLDPASITVTFAYGGNPAVVDTFSYTAAQVSAMTTAIPQLNLQPTRPQESSIQITITDNSSGSPVTGAGMRLEGVRIDYGVEPRGGYRTPVAQQG